MIGIYKITSPSGRVYIGQSVNIKNRFAYYKTLTKTNQRKLIRSFNKYGFENHVLEVVCECSIEELNTKERYYQELFDCVHSGLNCEYVSTDTKKAYRSEETRKKIGDFNRGIKRPKEICDKISKARKGMVFTDEHRESIRKSKTGQLNKRSILILNTFSGVIHESIAEAAFCYSLDHRTLSKYLLGHRRNKTCLVRI
jgi:group I intron endonuclease